jgi:glycosyltransferase involved in cell wall biosynthesis
MKILHINYHQNQGGASVASNRLLEALNKNNIESKLLVNEKQNENENVLPQFKNIYEIYIHKIKKILSIYIKKILGADNIYKDSISIFSSNLYKKINLSEFDIINLHWICNEMISIKEIKKINKPIVWTLVDMWPFAGSTHYTENDFYKFSDKKFDTKKLFNIQNWVLNRKIKYLDKDIVIICISKWLEKLAKQSHVFKNNKIYTIPCAIDTKDWQSIDKKSARKILNFDIDKKYFLFSAYNGIKDERKGFDLMLKALTKLDIDKKEFKIVILGNAESLNDINRLYKYDFKVFDQNFSDDKNLLKTIYSACDILIMPSRLEAFGQVALEAGSCSLPCVSFKNTGVEDIIKHKEDGYLAEYLDIEDLTKGINLLIQESIHRKMSINIRNKVIQEFSYEIISNKYKKVYESLI